MSGAAGRFYLAYGISYEEVEFRGLWSRLELAVAEARKTRLGQAYVAAVRVDEPRRGVEFMGLIGIMVGYRGCDAGGSLGPIVELDPEPEELEELDRV